MQKNFEEYYQLIKHVLRLQQALFQALETAIEIAPAPGFLEIEMYKKLRGIFRPEHTITEVLRIWPNDVSVIPLVGWVRPRIGVFHCEDQNWLFNIHGFLEVQFVGLPSGLEDNVLKMLKAGKMDILLDIPKYGPEIETSYFGKGRTDGISNQLMHVFTRSIVSKFAQLSESEHKELLEEMVREGILLHPPNHSYYFVLA